MSCTRIASPCALGKAGPYGHSQIFDDLRRVFSGRRFTKHEHFQQLGQARSTSFLTFAILDRLEKYGMGKGEE